MRFFDRVIAGFLPYTPKAIVGRVAERYIAGETPEDAIRVARGLNTKGFRATMDILGEDIHRIDQARTAAKNYRNLLDELARQKVDSTVSVKLTQLGLKVDKDECLHLADSVVAQASVDGNFVRIDMEDSSCTSDTLDLYMELRRRHENVGVVLQAYLRRTASDVERLIAELHPLEPNIRLCKGVYVEPESIAYHDMAEINRNYLMLLERFLRSGIYAGIATHDEHLVAEAQRMIAELRLTPEAYEFQMLLGVTEALRDRIRRAGHPLRVYIPFGRDWYAYSVRRLRENPRLAGYVLRAMFRR
jgi:proline dehydrogenase